ncbi:MAG TPA: extradiol ring-cleavage dioxygenase [candidate division Zixibacteria bacterium]|nr:extradiol ring-cleavage dioxygenase [candidate division Zixibacteria bacterium]
MPVVFACAASHAPGMTAWTEAAPREQAERFLGAYRALGARLAAAKPDAIVALTVEHWANFFLDHMPAFCIGRAPHYDGPVEEWLRIPKTRVPGDAPLGCALLDACFAEGFDPAFSDELLFDHATMLPLHFLNPEMALPVVPVIVNTLTVPMPSPRRCFALGRTLGRVLESLERRVAVVATGGLSHWPGEARHGKINTDFDREFLEILAGPDRARLADYSHERIASEAGSGGHEIRTWIALAGAVLTWKAEAVTYEPVAAWATGCALMAFEPPAP